jgi:hypothetical protein
MGGKQDNTSTKKDEHKSLPINTNENDYPSYINNKFIPQKFSHIKPTIVLQKLMGYVTIAN